MVTKFHKSMYIIVPRMLIIILLSIGNTLAFGYTLELTQEELQEKLDKKFPISKKKFFITATLKEPKVTLIEEGNRIGMKIITDLLLPKSILVNGVADIDGELRYEPKTGGFYLDKVQVKELRISDLPPIFTIPVNKLIEQALKEYLAKRPFYKLNQDDFNQALAKSLLKDVKIENGKLIAEISFF